MEKTLEWSDPHVIYDGMEVNAVCVEDTMYERFLEEGNEYSDDKFERFMKYSEDEVKELIAEIYDNNIAAKAEELFGHIKFDTSLVSELINNIL